MSTIPKELTIKLRRVVNASTETQTEDFCPASDPVPDGIPVTNLKKDRATQTPLEIKKSPTRKSIRLKKTS